MQVEPMDPTLRTRIHSMLGSAVVSSIPAAGGFSPATRERLVLADGRRAFVKAATDEATAGWLSERKKRAPWSSPRSESTR